MEHINALYEFHGWLASVQSEEPVYCRLATCGLSESPNQERHGVVTDGSGAVIANASVTLEDDRLQAVVLATTDEAGNYDLTAYPANSQPSSRRS